MTTCATENINEEPDWNGVFALGSSWPASEAVEEFQLVNEAHIGRRRSYPKTANLQDEGTTYVSSVSTIPYSPVQEETSFQAVEPALPLSIQVADLLAFVRSESQLSFRDELADVLDILFEPEPIPEMGDPLSIDSVKWLLHFLEVFPLSLQLPTLSLSPDGKIMACWRQGACKGLYLYFQDTGTVQHVIRHPNPTKPGNARRMTGEFSLSEDDSSKLTTLFTTFRAFAPWIQ